VDGYLTVCKIGEGQFWREKLGESPIAQHKKELKEFPSFLSSVQAGSRIAVDLSVLRVGGNKTDVDGLPSPWDCQSNCAPPLLSSEYRRSIRSEWIISNLKSKNS